IAGTSLFDREGKLIKTFVGENQNHFENFITAVRQKDRTILTADIEEAATSSSLCHIGNISYRLGTQVSADEMREKLLQQDLPETCLTATDDMLSHLQEHTVDYQQTPLTMGKRLIIDSETYSFIDPAANSLLTRQYRKPFVLPIEENL
ncbi:MAG: gfo/Idh/MocA family oxidoreductase, partial [Planctomycetaceae bacterium]|nr:gfo/Idh/MocA family oxidoreductase [Planctomycetaceae bacterium]